jgi:hypothetical protein
MARREKPAGATPAEKPKKQRFARTRQLKQVYDMTVRVDPGADWSSGCSSATRSTSPSSV